ncbi:hypothetical protein KN1_11600 [Stygiolobus caldivivus]|uniref:Uncharacterized protein n=1 Tax=Stygiolobus caldivivus TaxID=2824673 RepID=A0A8D5U6E9_9CREN|nr:hypothetical protein KN1_11600 [Stygiolobus caldivivus]
MNWLSLPEGVVREEREEDNIHLLYMIYRKIKLIRK